MCVCVCVCVFVRGAGTRAISSSSQLTHLVMDIGFTWAEARDVLLAGVKAAFLPEAERKVLIAEFEAELDATAAKLGLDWGASESGAAAAVEAQAAATSED